MASFPQAKSNAQLQWLKVVDKSLWKLCKKEIYRVCTSCKNLLTKKQRLKMKECAIRMISVVEEEIALGHSDSVAYERLFEIFHSQTCELEVFRNLTHSQERANTRIRDILNLIPRDLIFDKILDFGCDDGSITRTLAENFNLSSENVHGCDVNHLPEANSFQFLQISLESSLLPYEAGHFSLILALMTLHHVVNVKQTLIEFHRILKSDGILVIREHDCNSESFSLYLDIIHGFHAKLWSNPPRIPNFSSEFFSQYKSKIEWDELMQEVGFLREEFTQASRESWENSVNTSRNRMNSYYATYVKEDSCDNFLARKRQKII